MPESLVSTADPLRLRHRNGGSTPVLGVLDPLRSCPAWLMVAHRQQNLFQVPAVDCSLTNNAVVPPLCHRLLGECGTWAVEHRQHIECHLDTWL